MRYLYIHIYKYIETYNYETGLLSNVHDSQCDLNASPNVTDEALFFYTKI